MSILTVVFIALLCILSSNACKERLNFFVRPNDVYVGQNVSFECSINASATLCVSDSVDNFAFCDVVAQPEKRGIFKDTSCFKEAGRRLHAFITATTAIEKRSFTCLATVHDLGAETENCTSDSSISVSDIPKLSLTPDGMTFNDGQKVTIRCSTGMSKPETNVTLSVRRDAESMNATLLNSVEISINASRHFHKAEVRCEAPQVPQILAETKTLLVNYIYAKNITVDYHSVNSSQTLNCAEQVESHPDVQYNWFLENSIRTDVTQSFYTCQAPHWCNANLTCVATNNVTRVNITFIYQSKKHDSDQISDPTQIQTEEHASGNGNMPIILIATLCGGTLAIVSIVTVLVRKRLCCTRTRCQNCDDPCCKKKDCVISMTDNELYETMPALKALPSEHAEDICLVLASDTVDVNLTHKVGNNSYLVLFSDHSSTLRDIQGKIKETVRTTHSVKQVAFLLRQAKKGLILSLADNVNIDGDSVASDRRLQSFLKQLVENCMDKSSSHLRLDLLNCKDADTSKGQKMANHLARFLGINVILSPDMYGVTTKIDNNSCVADVYFNRQRIDDPVIYTDLDLSKDSRRIPADSREKVEYSEIVRPALRPPLSARR